MSIASSISTFKNTMINYGRKVYMFLVCFFEEEGSAVGCVLG